MICLFRRRPLPQSTHTLLQDILKKLEDAKRNVLSENKSTLQIFRCGHAAAGSKNTMPSSSVSTWCRLLIHPIPTSSYSHPLLCPKHGSELNLVDSGSVSDGDEAVEEKEPAALAPSSTRGTKRVLPAPKIASPPPVQTRGSGSGTDPFLVLTSDC